VASERSVTSRGRRIPVVCPGCSRRLRRPARDAGRSIVCPTCGRHLTVPHPPRLARGDVLVIEPADLDAPEVYPVAPAGGSHHRSAAARDAVRLRRHTSRPSPRHTRAVTRHIGKKCPYCQTRIEEGEGLTVCPECGIPHHVECWNENGGCTVWGCRAAPGPVVRPAPQTVPVHRGSPQEVFATFNRYYTEQQRGGSQSEGCLKATLAGSVVLAITFVLFGLASGAQSAMWGFMVVAAVIVFLVALFRRWRRQGRF